MNTSESRANGPLGMTLQLLCGGLRSGPMPTPRTGDLGFKVALTALAGGLGETSAAEARCLGEGSVPEPSRFGDTNAAGAGEFGVAETDRFSEGHAAEAGDFFATTGAEAGRFGEETYAAVAGDFGARRVPEAKA